MTETVKYKRFQQEMQKIRDGFCYWSVIALSNQSWNHSAPEYVWHHQKHSSSVQMTAAMQ